jgi:hypothetical protein
LVIILLTQKLVSIVNASSIASRDVPLRFTFALDPLELAALSFQSVRAYLGRSMAEAQRSEASIDGPK